MESSVQKDKIYSEYIPLKFEKICKEFLLKENKENKFEPPLLLIGSYSYNNAKLHTNGQFDIVTFDGKYYTFYECKFTNSKIDKKVYDEEIKQLKIANISDYKLGFFSKSGYSDDKALKDCKLFTIDDLYK